MSATTPTTSGLAEAIGAGRFVLTTGLGTLGGITREELRRRLRVAKEGFAFVKFGDNPRARARPSPWAAAAVALAEGLEPVAHVTCRDRNRLALESDLIGGRLLGVRNVLCLRGDEVELSDEPDARAVHHLDVVDLIRLASRVGEDELYLLAGCDPNAGASDSHLARLRQKLDAGASVLESQPVFDGARFADWLTRLRQAGIDAPLLVDISVVTTPGEARLLERIPFIRPPEALEARVRRDRLAGIALAAEVARAVRELPGVAGCHISPPGATPRPSSRWRSGSSDPPPGRHPGAPRRSRRTTESGPPCRRAAQGRDELHGPTRSPRRATATRRGQPPCAGRVLPMPITVLQQDWGAALGFDAAALWRPWAPNPHHQTVG